MMDDAQRQALANALLNKGTPNLDPAAMANALREGEWAASQRRPDAKMNVEGLLNTPEMVIPEMHKGKMLNLMGRGWSDGSAHSLDLYLQPKIGRQGIGLDGGGLLYRRVW